MASAPTPRTTPSLGGLQHLIGKRPAELTTAAAGGVGLLLANLLNSGEDVTTALVVVLAVLPGLVSFLHDLGAEKATGGGPAGSPSTDSGDTARVRSAVERAFRRASLNDPRWTDDVEQLTVLLPLAERAAALAAPATPPSPKNGAGDSTPKQSDGATS